MSVFFSFLEVERRGRQVLRLPLFLELAVLVLVFLELDFFATELRLDDVLEDRLVVAGMTDGFIQHGVQKKLFGQEPTTSLDFLQTSHNLFGLSFALDNHK